MPAKRDGNNLGRSAWGGTGTAPHEAKGSLDAVQPPFDNGKVLNPSMQSEPFDQSALVRVCNFLTRTARVLSRSAIAA